MWRMAWLRPACSVQTNWPPKFLKAAYNWQFVSNDGSMGVHNAPFAIGLLKASIADLTGDANNDGLPDAWQIQYFGSITNPARRAQCHAGRRRRPQLAEVFPGPESCWCPASLSPAEWSGPMATTGQLGGGTNTVQIYTAAEVAFNTAVGTTYQIQALRRCRAAGRMWAPRLAARALPSVI